VVAEIVEVVESEAKVVTRAEEEVEGLDGGCESYVVVKELLGKVSTETVVLRLSSMLNICVCSICSFTVVETSMPCVS
jgi:hypothetical protein